MFRLVGKEQLATHAMEMDVNVARKGRNTGFTHQIYNALYLPPLWESTLTLRIGGRIWDSSTYLCKGKTPKTLIQYFTFGSSSLITNILIIDLYFSALL